MKKVNKAFTLIELMLVIGVISIIAIGSSGINFNRLNDKQKIEIFSNKIITIFEQVRNNALLGKGIGTNMVVPEKWRLDFNNSGSGRIITKYMSGTTNWVTYDENIFKDLFEIEEIQCTNLNNTNIESFSGSIYGTGTIEINGNNITLTGTCNDPSYKKLVTTVKYKKYFKEKIEINIVNGLIKKL